MTMPAGATGARCSTCGVSVAARSDGHDSFVHVHVEPGHEDHEPQILAAEIVYTQRGHWWDAECEATGGYIGSQMKLADLQRLALYEAGLLMPPRGVREIFNREAAAPAPGG